MNPERRARWLLALGAATGLAAATVGIVGGIDAWRPPPGAVAVVNGVPILRDEYQHAVDAVARDRRTPLEDADRRRILDRLIDEELLLQRGLELDLVRHDRTVRSQIVSATMALLARGETTEPTDEQLRAFYERNREYFTTAGRLRVRQVLIRVARGVSDEAALARARDATLRLRAGEPFDAVRAALGDADGAPIPDAFLPPTKLREYVGETAVRVALDTDPGGTSDPVRSATGYHVLQVLAHEPPRVPPLDQIRDVVRTELRRRGDDEALRASLDALRTAATLRVLPLPPP